MKLCKKSIKIKHHKFNHKFKITRRLSVELKAFHRILKTWHIFLKSTRPELKFAKSSRVFKMI